MAEFVCAQCVAIRRICDSCRSSVSIGHLLFTDDVLDASGHPKCSVCAASMNAVVH